MRLFIMTDLEGTAGVVDFWGYSRPGFPYHEIARRLVTLEVNAAIEGALDAGVTDIHVLDGHGPGAINVELLHPEATVLTGRPIRYPFALDSSYDLIFMTGYHAKSNTDGGHMSHSWSMDIEEMWINGVSIGEIGTWLLYAGQIGVPVPLLTGDAAACEEAMTFVPNIRTVSTKTGVEIRTGNRAFSRWQSQSQWRGHAYSSEKARELIRDAARRAVDERNSVDSYIMNPPYEVVTIRRPLEDGDVHMFSKIVVDDVAELMAADRNWEPLARPLADVVNEMNTNGISRNV